MQSKEASEVIRPLGRAISTIERTTEDSVQVHEATDLPKAFPVVSKWLPVVQKVLSSMRSQLKMRKADQETQEDKDGYPEMKQVAGECADLADRLEILYGAVASADATPRIERYSDAVGGGDRLEKVMRDLISRVAEVARAPLVSEDEIRELQEALAEVKQVPPSLEEDASGRYVFNNTGAGIQPVYLGKGNQNINSGGGPQITGDASKAQFYFGSAGVPKAEEPKGGVRK